jgi:hypothetical protein
MGRALTGLQRGRVLATGLQGPLAGALVGSDGYNAGYSLICGRICSETAALTRRETPLEVEQLMVGTATALAV